jgi:hypothetical protein
MRQAGQHLGDSIECQVSAPGLQLKQSYSNDRENSLMHENQSLSHQYENTPAPPSLAEFLVQHRKTQRKRAREQRNSDTEYDASESTTSSQDERELEAAEFLFSTHCYGSMGAPAPKRKGVEKRPGHSRNYQIGR